MVSGIIDAVPHISVISQIEILRFTDTPENERVLADFVNAAVIHPLSDTVVHRTIALCKQSKIKLPDRGDRPDRKFCFAHEKQRRFQKYTQPQIA